MKTTFRNSFVYGGFSLWLLLSPAVWAATGLPIEPQPPGEPFTIFGLTHATFGESVARTEGGNLIVTPPDGWWNNWENPCEFGVSVSLGEADSGLFAHLNAYNSFQNSGAWMTGQTYGQVNGQPDQPICSLSASSQTYDQHAVYANFQAIGATFVTYEIYNGSRLVTRVPHATGPAIIFTSSETSPRANPFWKMADGSVAAVVKFAWPESIRIGSCDEDCWDDPEIRGDLIVIRPENVSATVDFASRMDVTAGGANYEIYITQEQLGVFNHAHRALGEAILDAFAGELTVARLAPTNWVDEIGVSIQLEDTRRFAVGFVPLELATNGATLVASAIASAEEQGGEFLGYAGVQNRDGALHVFGDFSFCSDGLQVSVLRHGVLAGMVGSPTLSPSIGMSGNPRLVGVDGTAARGAVKPGLALRFDRFTTFSLPDGSALEGDQIRFQAANTVPLPKLTAFNLTCSNLPSFAIVSESGQQSIEVADYFAEATAPAYLKKFRGTNELGEAVDFVRSGATTNRDGRTLVVVTDRSSESNAVSSTWSLQEDGLHFHGYTRPPLALFGTLGPRTVPEEISVGDTYFSAGSLDWHDAASGQDHPVLVSSVTTVGAVESLSLDAGVFFALRLDTVTEFTGSGASNLPTARLTTNWLAAGVGEVKFVESEVFPGAIVRSRSGELTDYAVVRTPLRGQVANVGANVLLDADILTSPGAFLDYWAWDGAPLDPDAYEFQDYSGTRTGRVKLTNLQLTNAGVYSVVVSVTPERELVLSADVARLDVLPFSDAPGFWAATVSSTRSVYARATAVDASGNVYLAGTFRGTVTAGSVTLGTNASYQSDMFLMKLDAAGQVLWAKQAGSANEDSVAAVGVDAAGNVYMLGSVGGTVRFDAIQLAALGSSTFFVAKADPNGNFLWAVTASGNPEHLSASSMAVDAAGHQYVLGGFRGTVTFGSVTFTNDSGNWSEYDLFLAKLDSDGQFLWAQQVPSANSVYAGAVVVDGTGNLYVAGSYYGSVQFGATELQSSSYQYVGFLAKADPVGNFLWAKSLGSSTLNLGLDSAGNVCAVGEFYGTINLEGVYLTAKNANYGGASSTYITQFAPGGALRWARVSDVPPGYGSTPLAVDSADNVYVAGGIYTEATLGSTTFFAPQYRNNTVVTKLAPDGQPLWYKQIGGDQNVAYGLARDDDGNIYLVGTFEQYAYLGDVRISDSTGASLFVARMTGATAPAFTQQPLSQTVDLGAVVSFTVTATGTAPLSYQWRRNGANIEGATGPSLILVSAQPSDRGSYTVVVKNAGGIVLSDTATLEVNAPEAGTFVLGDASYSVNETNSLAIVTVLRTGSTATAATVDFQTGDGTATAGRDYWVTAVSLRFAPGETVKEVAVPVLDDLEHEMTEFIILRLSNPGAGAVVGLPDTAAIAITDNDPPGPPVIRRQPADRTVATTYTATFQVVARGEPPLFYQWRKDEVPIPGATERTLTIQNARLADAGVYSVVVSNAYGVVVSSNATLVVNPLPVIVAQPQSQTIPYGEPVTFSVIATSSYPLVTQVLARAFTGSDRDWMQFSGGGATLQVQYDFKSDPDALEVYAVVGEEPVFLGSLATNGAGVFTVDCSSALGSPLAIQVTAGTEGGGDGWSYQVEQVTSPLTYRWRKDGGTLYEGSGTSYTIRTVTFADAGEYTVVVTDPAGSVVSEPAILTVAGPLLRVVPVTCPGTTNACIQLFWTVTDYHLEKQDDPTDLWHDVPNASSGIILPVCETQCLYRLRRTERPD